MLPVSQHLFFSFFFQRTLEKYILKVTNQEENRKFNEAMENIKSRGLSEVIEVNKSERDLIENYLKQ